MKSSSRLKNFCELCRKLCRDQNGYICHLNSSSHQKRVQQFRTNPQQIIDKYSHQMERKFIQIIKTKYPGQNKHLQTIYNQYEQQSKRFIKFSNTRWKSLKEFGEYLASGEVKNVKVTGVPPDCYVMYTVNKTMEFIEKNKKEHLQMLKQKQKELFQKSLQNRIQRQKAQQQRQSRKFQQQMRRVEQQKSQIVLPDKLQFSFQNWGDNMKRNAFISAEQLQRQAQRQLMQNASAATMTQKKLQNSERLLSKLMPDGERRDQGHVKGEMSKGEGDDEEMEWITPGIIVKIKPHEIDTVFHNKKTQVLQVVEPYVAKVQVGTATLEIDQAYLQTVIPKINHQVLVINGEKKGQRGLLTEVDLIGGFGSVEIQGKKCKIPFNYFSKFQTDQRKPTQNN